MTVIFRVLSPKACEVYIIEWNLYEEVLPLEYIICLCSFLAHASFKLKNFKGFWIFNCFVLYLMSMELSMQNITMIDSLGMSQR